jgi:hypothetical protein
MMDMALAPEIIEQLKKMRTEWQRETAEYAQPVDLLNTPGARLSWRVRTLKAQEGQAGAQLKQAETAFQNAMDRYVEALTAFDAKRFTYEAKRDLKVAEMDFQSTMDSFLARFAAFNLLMGARQACEAVEKEMN